MTDQIYKIPQQKFETTIELALSDLNLNCRLETILKGKKNFLQVSQAKILKQHYFHYKATRVLVRMD
ncbi:unnamed protein product [Allacma fusca]|uniref:Uncharacterized protein n=1 Tax=Allacma fusca TaxID=39272 RepID=A0A8J2KLR0_9HEXA|nr:unnamed protein product [Allacma fusca]